MRSTWISTRTPGSGRAVPSRQAQSTAVTHEQTVAFQQTVAVSQELRDKIANFDDFFRPLRNYFYWEPHCFDTPICWALRSLFDALDGINQLTDQLDNVSAASPSSMSCRPGLRRLRQRQRPSCWTRCDGQRPDPPFGLRCSSFEVAMTLLSLPTCGWGGR